MIWQIWREPGLFVSALKDRTDTAKLENRGIRQVVSLLEEGQHVMHDTSSPVNPRFKHYRFNVGDSDRQQPEWFSEICQLIHAGGATLVHCVSGSNRSGTVALCYLIGWQQMSVVDALAYYAQARPGYIQSCEMRDNFKAYAEWVGAKL